MSREIAARGQQPPVDQPPTPGASGPVAASDTAALQAENERLTGEIRRLNASVRVLQSKYDKETPRLMSENDALKKQLEELQAAAQRKVEAGVLTSVTDEERSLAGPMLDVVAKVAREVAEGTIDARLKSVNEKLGNFERQHEASYYATLDAGIPGWDATDGSSINDDPKFLNWLQSMDPETNRTRWTLLKNAEAARQGHAIVEIVNAFREGRDIGARTAPPKPRTPRVDPPQGGDSQPPIDQPKGKIWSRAEIAQFYKEKNLSPKYQGVQGKAKAREVEQEIFAAQRDGRISG
ncbi:MAG: hypothetical protein OEW90_00885 [Betaproteobacteria bacterium]|nr:hypothetical protein [Betaproteobacteria bacterium]MDH4322672.1 hypothetical protein [Betaproteobacteria bacterium]